MCVPCSRPCIGLPTRPRLTRPERSQTELPVFRRVVSLVGTVLVPMVRVIPSRPVTNTVAMKNTAGRSRSTVAIGTNVNRRVGKFFPGGMP